MKKKRYDNQKLIPVEVIKAAANGDPAAVRDTLSGCPQGPCMMHAEKHIM